MIYWFASSCDNCLLTQWFVVSHIYKLFVFVEHTKNCYFFKSSLFGIKLLWIQAILIFVRKHFKTQDNLVSFYMSGWGKIGRRQDLYKPSPETLTFLPCVCKRILKLINLDLDDKELIIIYYLITGPLKQVNKNYAKNKTFTLPLRSNFVSQPRGRSRIESANRLTNATKSLLWW